jgi:hypothetical protein
MDHSSFSIDDEISSQKRRFNATGTQRTLRLLPPPDDNGVESTNPIDPMTHFVSSINDIFQYALKKFAD